MPRTIGFILTGQSLAEGGVGDEKDRSLERPFRPERCLMFSPRPVASNSGTLTGEVVGLSESWRHTIAHSFTRRLAESDRKARILFHGQAWGGKAYADLKKGGSSGVYERIIAQVQNAVKAFPDITYKAMCVIHGERDGQDGNGRYAMNLREWLADFNADIRAITGQSQRLVMLLCQTSSSSGYGHRGGIDSEDFPVALEQLKAHEEHEGVYLVCPKYFLPYHDHAHLTHIGQRILGEYYAKAYASIARYGRWSPLRPVSVTGAGKRVSVAFTGNAGRLVFDTERVKPAENYGFAYADDSGRSIVDIGTHRNRVVITLDGPMGENPRLSYAYQNGADGLGERGNLRDSDRAVSVYDGSRLYNWAVTFRRPVNVITGQGRRWFHGPLARPWRPGGGGRRVPGAL